MKWYIYYIDDVYFHEHNVPYYAPGKDVIGIVYKTEAGWLFMSGYHYYVWRVAEDKWSGISTQDALFFYLEEPGLKKVLFTREISDTAFDAVVSQAIAKRRELNDA